MMSSRPSRAVLYFKRRCPMLEGGMKRTSCVTRVSSSSSRSPRTNRSACISGQCLACGGQRPPPGIGLYPWPQSTDGMYEDKEIYPPRLGDPAIYEAHPQFLKDSINRQRFFWGYDTPEKYSDNVRAYFRMISGIDNGVARVLAALKEAGLAENTIVVYPETTDTTLATAASREMVALRGVAARADGDL